MFSLLVRVVVLFAVVAGIAYGVSRALRANAHARHAKNIQDEIRALKAGLEQGLYTQKEYATLKARIEQACEREGIDIPELPGSIERGTREDDT